MLKKIDYFLKLESIKQKIIVIYWPTWSWKTSMSIDVAKKLNSEIISTDSRQIFKYLDIGTGKITDNEKKWIIHYMLDIITPDLEYSVWEFKNKSEKIISDIYSRWKIPILCWGTWLYIDSLIYDFNIPKVPADEKLRKELEKESEKYWNEYIYKKLKDIDPEYASSLHSNNLRYIIRWIEIKLLTWKSKLDFKEEKNLKYDTLFLTPFNWDREYLYNRINKRVLIMFDDWLVDEVKNLLKIYKKSDFWMKTIWYKEVIDYLEGKIDLEECIELVKKHNRNYAKRQLTWFRNYEKF